MCVCVNVCGVCVYIYIYICMNVCGVCVCVCGVCLAECNREASILRSSRPTGVSVVYHHQHEVGPVMAQKSSSRPLTTEARVRSQASFCGICGEQSGTETSLPPRTLVLPCQYYCTIALLHHCTIAPLHRNSYFYLSP